MHDLEQAALEDPFLADALEGMTLHPNLKSDLNELRQRLAAKVTENTRRIATRTLRRRLAIAAVFILLLGIAGTFFYLIAYKIGDRYTPLPHYAANPKSRAAAPTPQADSTALAARQATTLRETTLARTSPAKASKAKAKEAKTLAPPAADAEVAIAPPVTPPPTATPLPAATASPVAASPAAGLRIQKDSSQYNFKTANKSQTLNNAYYLAANHPLVYRGKVLDAQNRPIAGASLSLNGLTNIRTLTDQQGMFNISLPPQDSTSLLTIARIGYNQASLTLNTLSTDRQAGNVIYLQPHPNNLDEVVVDGYGAARKETRAGIPSDKDEKLDTLWQKASPSVGREAYLLYLAAAKNKLGLDSTITGVETISFEVDRNGILSAFKIEQSLSPAHDAGVIRLINEGPSWGLLKGKSKKVRAAVSVIF
jgi:hypothetical protein